MTIFMEPSFFDGFDEDYFLDAILFIIAWMMTVCFIIPTMWTLHLISNSWSVGLYTLVILGTSFLIDLFGVFLIIIGKVTINHFDKRAFQNDCLKRMTAFKW